jgi:hypothetical protein
VAPYTWRQIFINSSSSLKWSTSYLEQIQILVSNTSSKSSCMILILNGSYIAYWCYINCRGGKIEQIKIHYVFQTKILSVSMFVEQQ